MTGQYHLSQYNIGDGVHHEGKVNEDGTPKKGIVVQYHTMRFGVSKIVNSMNLRPGLYCINDGLLIDWGDGVPVFHDALELELVRPEFPKKTRLTRARIEALERPIYIGPLPELKVDIGDWVRFGENKSSLGLVTEIDYIAALEKDFSTGESRPCFYVENPSTKETHILYPGELELFRRGAAWSLKNEVDRFWFYTRREYDLFVETTGVTAGTHHDDFVLSGVSTMDLTPAIGATA